jgi:hypothetical protein
MMIWFAISWLAVGSAVAVLFGLMAHRSRATLEKQDTLNDAGGSPRKAHVPAH